MIRDKYYINTPGTVHTIIILILGFTINWQVIVLAMHVGWCYALSFCLSSCRSHASSAKYVCSIWNWEWEWAQEKASVYVPDRASLSSFVTRSATVPQSRREKGTGRSTQVPLPSDPAQRVPRPFTTGPAPSTKNCVKERRACSKVSSLVVLKCLWDIIVCIHNPFGGASVHIEGFEFCLLQGAYCKESSVWHFNTPVDSLYASYVCIVQWSIWTKGAWRTVIINSAVLYNYKEV